MDNLARFSIWDWEQSQKEKSCPCCKICGDYVTSDGLHNEFAFGTIHNSHTKTINIDLRYGLEAECILCDKSLVDNEEVHLIEDEYVCEECYQQAANAFELQLWYG